MPTGLTLREIERILNLTEGRISQILRAAMIRLRTSLSDTLYLPEGATGDRCSTRLPDGHFRDVIGLGSMASRA